MTVKSLLKRRTKIICTIGPACGSAEDIERLIKAGMNIARLNLSHGTRNEHIHYIKNVRTVSTRLGIPVALLIDIPGPKYRTGNVVGGSATLRKGTLIALTIREVEGNEREVSINYPTLPSRVKAGDVLLVDDGAIELRAEEITATDVVCKVIVGGQLTPHRGVVVPGMRISDEFVTDLLRSYVRFAISCKPDYIALSFVTRPDDVVDTKKLIDTAEYTVPIISKIERSEALTHLDQIIAVSDGIMVARGDLGVDIPIQKVPLVQKDIIRKCNRAGKPVITATQMLESMINAARPTRAEVADIANAIFDGTDAIMLSAETSIGKYPVRAVKMMDLTAVETEQGLPYEHLLSERSAWLEISTAEMISYDACHTAQKLGAVAIIAFTQSGSTAQRVSKYRPRVPILGITPNKSTFNKLLLNWGVTPFLIPVSATLDELMAMGVSLVKELKVAHPGDLIVMTGGIPIGIPGTTNLLKVERIS